MLQAKCSTYVIVDKFKIDNSCFYPKLIFWDFEFWNKWLKHKKVEGCEIVKSLENLQHD